MKISNLNRIYFNCTLSKGSIINLNEKYLHYLKNVLRLKINDQFRIFNGTEGEFIATIIDITKNNISINLSDFIRKPTTEVELTLGLCIIKPDKMIDAINMAVQLGVTKIIPLTSQRSQFKEVNNDRLLKCIIEATEQTERLSPPTLSTTKLLKRFNKEMNGIIIYANENESESNSLIKLGNLKSNISLIIGPEGGFSDEELSIFSLWDNTFSISLGSNILRTETAVATALAQIMLIRNMNI